MDEIIRMTPEQAAKVKKVVKKQCCNCMDGNCLLLDGLDPCSCPQLITRPLICRWFLLAVLPGEKELHQELIERGERKSVQSAGPYIAPLPTGASTAPTALR